MADHIILMRDGEIVQEGTPAQLYDMPNNLFVASFLGTPQINTFDCTVTEENGRILLVSPEIRTEVNDADQEALKSYIGKEITLGIRPSDLVLVDDEAEAAVKATIDSMELLGDAYLVYVRCGEKVLIFKNTDLNTKLNSQVLLKPDLCKLHLFEKENGHRIN